MKLKDVDSKYFYNRNRYSTIRYIFCHTSLSYSHTIFIINQLMKLFLLEQKNQLIELRLTVQYFNANNAMLNLIIPFK